MTTGLNHVPSLDSDVNQQQTPSLLYMGI